MARLPQGGGGARRIQRVLACLCGACIGAAALGVRAQQRQAVEVQVELVQARGGKKPGRGAGADFSNVAVWLTPLQGGRSGAGEPNRGMPRLVQRNKTFVPHVLVVQAGSMVQFPNEDPFFHNVFSLFAGKRFDLGLYESGSSRSVRFDKPGASFLFCNIHPEMSAVILVVATPYYGLSDKAGRVKIEDVPEGRYRLEVWHERSSPEALKNAEQVVTVSGATRTFGPIGIPDNTGLTLTHKNKYGQDYVPALMNTAY